MPQVWAAEVAGYGVVRALVAEAGGRSTACVGGLHRHGTVVWVARPSEIAKNIRIS